MPELPEVETVKKVLLGWVKNKKITNSYVYHKGIIEDLNLINGETILDVTRYGKNLMFVLDNYVLTSHLRLIKLLIEFISSVFPTSPFMSSLCPQHILYQYSFSNFC